MAKFTDEEMLATYERLLGQPPEKLQEYLDSLSDEQKIQYGNFSMEEKRRRDKAEKERKEREHSEKVQSMVRAEEERRANLTPEERAREDKNAKIGCGVILAVIVCVLAWIFWPKSDAEIAKENQIKAEQQAAKQAEQQKAAEQAAANKAAAEQQAKAAFQTWNNTVQGYLQSVDADWEQLWRGTAVALGNQSMDRFTAYNNIDQLEKRLEIARDNFSNLRAPDGVSSEQKDALNKANADYVTWIYTRREACQKFKEMLDSNNISPAKMKDITDTISQGDAFAVTAAAGILDVENQLGLIK